ncbi:PREDICTED: protein FAR1-RELATED SEQUENCE 7-like [Ipomoea nil]|uniref:protein FAR1-RELATED SEQUENCE 7-like n=1 Tax=Ipomoea nil TaxID=35883 RepID=UPI000901B7CB|nr:PREDICTED: protein FAR1-RELATED SEQUENCE 7-like [Ipomoea nil]
MDEATNQSELNVDRYSMMEVRVNEDLVGDSLSTDQGDLNIDGSSSIPVSNGDEAFELYNEHAYRVGFSVRKGKQRYKASTKTIQMKRFYCSKAGFKCKADGGVKLYSKIDTRTGCGAFVQFDVGGDGLWTVAKHMKVHNHELCDLDKSHLLRSHRRAGSNQLSCLKVLKQSGVGVPGGIRFLKHQSGGSSLVGFTSPDAYNSLACDTVKSLDGTDSNYLIEIFRRRQSNEMVTEFKCHKNSWLGKLYDCREKWCPAFNKDYFSGGILSSQRSETTNHSISRRLSKNAGLCDFYSSFVGVISEWRSKENGEDFRCAQGVPAMMIDHVKLLSHAREVYTIEIYFLFEEQLMKGSACHQEIVLNDGCQYKYHVWRPDVDIIRHEVSFKRINLDISCSCKLFSEMGILCCHCLRILDINCVPSIPDKYIMKRWTKKVAAGRNVNFDSLSYNVGVPHSIWVVEISRKFQKLVVSSQDNSVARQFCDEAVENACKEID